MPRTGRVGEQHDTCAISGFIYPVSDMFVQRGRRVSFEHGDMVPNADFFRQNWDIAENEEGKERVLPDGPVEEIAP